MRLRYRLDLGALPGPRLPSSADAARPEPCPLPPGRQARHARPDGRGPRAARRRARGPDGEVRPRVSRPRKMLPVVGQEPTIGRGSPGASRPCWRTRTLGGAGRGHGLRQLRRDRGEAGGRPAGGASGRGELRGRQARRRARPGSLGGGDREGRRGCGLPRSQNRRGGGSVLLADAAGGAHRRVGGPVLDRARPLACGNFAGSGDGGLRGRDACRRTAHLPGGSGRVAGAAIGHEPPYGRRHDRGGWDRGDRHAHGGRGGAGAPGGGGRGLHRARLLPEQKVEAVRGWSRSTARRGW